MPYISYEVGRSVGRRVKVAFNYLAGLKVYTTMSEAVIRS